MRRTLYDSGMPASSSSVMVELALLALSAASFWLLDRYVAACEKI